MNRRCIWYSVLFLVILSAVPVHAQTEEQSAKRSGFFIAPLVEVLGYSRKGPAFGGGLAIGAGNGVAIGAHFLYTVDTELVSALELAVFMRFYLLGPEAHSGPFVQITVGAAVFALKSIVSFPAEAGTISAGLTAGWRFLLRDRWYIEPAIRAGYPYIAGAGVSAGFRL